MASDDELEWPALGYETLPWVSRLGRGVAPRNQLRRHQGPYRAAVLPQIARRRPVLANDVLAEAEDASNEISRFDAEMSSEIAPFAAVLLRSESAASSQIENLTASARAIAEAELGSSSRRNAAQIVANTRAMEAAVALAEKLDGEAVLAMHRALLEASDPAEAGRWRREQVWVGGSSLGPHEADFVPPHHSRVEPAIDDLVDFMARNDLPILMHAAIAHAQFETIHPFTDGNGRTGRALLHSMLRNKGLTRAITVPVSAGLLTDTAAYFDALGSYRDGDPAPMVRQLSQASFNALANGRQLVAELREIRAGWGARITARRDSAVWRVADLLMRRPVVNAPLLIRELGITSGNIYRHVDQLVDGEVLTEFTDQRRNRAWRAAEVLTALDSFAARAGRRRLSG